ncbi:MAG: nicotinate-nucleotide adenylyltransferase [Coriobacteriales bacterium]|nr:nicotinate-nucleotide adenylyltransferase [Coriobacteriales bacterium]
MRIGILGGTFDPPHIGHLLLARFAQEQAKLDLVLFIPTGMPYKKSHLNVTSAKRRLEMLRLAIAGESTFKVSDIEVMREGPTYTVDTLFSLQDIYGKSSELFFIAGADTAADMSSWKDADVIASMITILVASRENEAHLEIQPMFNVKEIAMPRIDVSSKIIRERAASGLSIRYFVHDSIIDYCKTHGLYFML